MAEATRQTVCETIVRRSCWMGNRSPCEPFYKLKEANALHYSDSSVVGSNGFVNSVYKTADSFGKNREMMMLVSCC